jgi:hypothetical protein
MTRRECRIKDLICGMIGGRYKDGEEEEENVSSYWIM